MKAAIGRLLDALFPRDTACFLCDREAHVDACGLCEECASRVHRAGELGGMASIQAVYAAFWYEEPLHAAIYRFKYGRAKYLAFHFAACMQLPEEFHADAIVPVPLYASREKARGYNQSMLLARMLSQKYNIPVEPHLLVRTRDTAPQAGLRAQERRGNVAGAFKAAPAVNGRALLLVDDVVTTGSTLRACAQALNEAGAACVYAACACAAPLGRVDTY